MPEINNDDFWSILAQKRPKVPLEYVTRYQSWDDLRHKEALLKSYLFFSNPNSWKDKNDCKFILGFGDQRKQVIQEMLELSNTDPSAKDLSLIKREEILSSFSNQDLEEIYSNAQRAEYARRLGIVCFSKNIDDENCWEKYIEKNVEGAFSVIFDFNKLLELQFPLVEIDYLSDLMKFTRGDGTSPDFRLATIISQKEILEYGWEGEIRMVGFFSEQALNENNEIPDEARNVIVPPSIYNQILVHENARKNLENEIFEALRSTSLNGLKIIRQSKETEFKHSY